MNSVDFVTLTKFQLEEVKYRGEIFQSEQSRREHVKGGSGRECYQSWSSPAGHSYLQETFR